MMRRQRLDGAALLAVSLSLAIITGLAPLPTRAVAPHVGGKNRTGRRVTATSRTPEKEASRAPAPSPAPRASVSALKVEKNLGQLPASFELNVGQADARVRFLSRGVGHALLLADDGALLALPAGGVRREGERVTARPRRKGETPYGARNDSPSRQLLRMKFVGASPRHDIVGEGELKGKANYFIGNDPSKWRAGVPTYARVRYRRLYAGVDLVYHGGRGGLEYDFVVAPGTDARSIRLRFEGAEGLSLDASGGLLIKTKTGTLRQERPVIYQEAEGGRREVAGGYAILGKNEVGFRVAGYDPRAPLVIDPVLVYSTYFLPATRMAVDTSGNVYVVGTVESFDQPGGDTGLPVTPGAFQKTLRGFGDAFVAKFDAAGGAFDYVTYLGGAGADPNQSYEYGNGIAVDADGDAYVTGVTYSADFPVVNAFQPTKGKFSDAFVTKLNPSGSALLYSSFLGGSDEEWGNSVAVDASGSAYLFGETSSPDFPTKNPLQASKKGFNDLFIAKVAPGGTSLVYSTYLGGSDSEVGYLGEIAVDASGSAYVAASSNSNDYPVTPNAFQRTTTASGSSFTFSPDVVVSKLAPDGAALIYSTYLGGSGHDYAYAIAVDASGQAHVAGVTGSQDFPTKNALQTASRFEGSGFLSKLNAAGTALVYSTYLSGSPPPPCGPDRLFDLVICDNSEFAEAVATDGAGNAYVVGRTGSADFPAPVGAVQPNLSGPFDAYVIKLDPAGHALFSTYLGGSSYEEGLDVYADAAGTAYVLGSTASNDFPTVKPYRDSFARELDPLLGGFLVKLSDSAASDQVSRVHFESPSYSVDEGGRGIEIRVIREGGLSREVTVDYATGDGTASERSDYETARGTLRFAPGETIKSFTVFVNDDNSVEGDETLTLALDNLRGDAALDAPSTAVLTVRDNDEHPTQTNPIDDSSFFVRQHYLDFLGREPDAPGLQFWTNEIESCGTDRQCRDVKRINVSAAFFLSIECQNTGFLVERMYRAAFGVSVSYESFVHDAREVGDGVVVGQGDWEQRLEANKKAFADEFVGRVSFKERYPDDMTAAQYVDRLNANTGGSLSTSERDALVAGLSAGTETRASVILKVAEADNFRRREFNAAFVLMQYFGYLRRDPDDAGFQFWLSKLNQFGGDWRAAEMVRAFVSSDEYRGRFNDGAQEATLGTPFVLRFGGTAVVTPDKLKVSFVDVGFDSRCPQGMTCATPGSVSILVKAVKAGGETARFVLKIEGGVPRPDPANPPVEALGYKFKLLQLDPEPPHGAQSFTYEATLQVDKTGV